MIATISLSSFVFGSAITGIIVWAHYNKQTIDTFMKEITTGKKGVEEHVEFHFTSRKEYQSQKEHKA